MAYNKGLHNGGGSTHHSHRGRPYALMLLIAFGAALLGVMVLHKLRERRIYNLLLKDKDNQLLSLQLLFQKERDRTKELRNKNEEMKGKIYALRIQKMELGRRVVEMQSTMDSLREEQKVMESAFEEKQNELRTMQEKGINLGGGSGSEITALTENLKQKEAEIQDLKRRLEIPDKTLKVSIDDPAIISETVTGNGTTMVAQDQTENESKEKEQHSLDSAKYEGDDKRTINDDASNSKVTMFKDGEVVVGAKDEIEKDEKAGEKKEDPQDDGGAGAGATGKGIEAEGVDGVEKKAIPEQRSEQLENNTNAGDEHSKVKLSADNSRASAVVVKRKHGHLNKTKGKRWKTVVKNKLTESNGVSESHSEVKMGNRKVYRNEKGELKGRIEGGVSDEENAAREEKPQVKLLKPENQETKDARNIVVNDTNHQLTNNGINVLPEKEKLGEIRQEERKEDSIVQQNWSRRHINKANKDGGQSNPKVFNEEHEEIEVSREQKQEKFMNEGEEDHEDFFKGSQSDDEDEKDEYKEEIDESEFQPDL